MEEDLGNAMRKTFELPSTVYEFCIDKVEAYGDVLLLFTTQSIRENKTHVTSYYKWFLKGLDSEQMCFHLSFPKLTIEFTFPKKNISQL